MLLFLSLLITTIYSQSCTDTDREKLLSSPVVCTFAQIMADCGSYYFFKSIFEDCLITKTGISKSCTGCFYNNVQCTVGKCSTCITQPTSPACIQCSQMYCVPSLSICTGIPQDRLPPPVPPTCCPMC